jgi:LCP family protein required for cell wall assembly
MEDNLEISRSSSRIQRRSQKQLRRRKRRSILSIIMLTILIGLISTVGYAYWQIQKIANPDETRVNAQGKDTDLPPVSIGRQGPFAIAIIGTDNRDGSGGTLNSDVLMVAVVQPENKQVHLLSIPRDTKVKVPGYRGYRKVNSAYPLGESMRNDQENSNESLTASGPNLVKETLSELLDIPIPYHIQIDFKGFKEVVDSVGGVKVDVQRSLIYEGYTDGTHINIKKGIQVLDGENALDYVRHRLDSRGPNYQSNDFERNQRQQEIIRSTVDKLTSFSGITNLHNVLDAVTAHTTTNLSVEQMTRLMWDFKKMSAENIHTIENEAYWDSGQSFTIIPDEKLHEIQFQLQSILNETKEKE